CLLPNAEITHLVQFQPRHLLQKEPVTSRGNIEHCPVASSRAQALGRQHRSVDLNLTKRIVEKSWFNAARSFQQRLPAQVLEYDLQSHTVVKAHFQLFHG